MGVLKTYNKVLLTRAGIVTCACCGANDCTHIVTSRGIYQGTFTQNVGSDTGSNVQVPLDYCCNPATQAISGSFTYTATVREYTKCNIDDQNFTGYNLSWRSVGVLVQRPEDIPDFYSWRIATRIIRPGVCNKAPIDKSINEFYLGYTKCTDLVAGDGAPRFYWLIADPDDGHTVFTTDGATSTIYEIQETLAPNLFTHEHTGTFTGGTEQYPYTAFETMSMRVDASDPCYGQSCTGSGGASVPPVADKSVVDRILRSLGIRVNPPPGLA